MLRRIGGLLLALSLAACAGNQAQPSPADGDDGGGDGGGEAASVSIVDFGFEPATVSVAANQTIAWTNTGAVPHTVTFDEGPDSGTLQPDATFEHAFAEQGQYDYICTIHPSMRGVVNVGP